MLSREQLAKQAHSNAYNRGVRFNSYERDDEILTEEILKVLDESDTALRQRVEELEVKLKRLEPVVKIDSNGNIIDTVQQINTLTAKVEELEQEAISLGFDSVHVLGETFMDVFNERQAIREYLGILETPHIDALDTITAKLTAHEETICGLEKHIESLCETANERERFFASVQNDNEQLRVAQCATITRLADALRALHDEQNGPPLETRAVDWHTAMEQAQLALAEKEGV